MERTLVDANNGSGLEFSLGSFGRIIDSTITHNTQTGDNGAGINNGGELDVVNTTISDNTTDPWGGGINNDGILRLIGSTIRGNDDGLGAAGILSEGCTLIIYSTISGNLGNGIYVTAGEYARLSMFNSTVPAIRASGFSLADM